MSSVPTIQELDKTLDKLVDWERFALHLPGMTWEDIKEIKRNDRQNNCQKMALYNHWLDRHPNASWNDVNSALESAKENTIAEQIKERLSSLQSMSQKQLQLCLSSSSPSRNIPSQTTSDQCEYEVSKTIVNKLEKLHETFVPLATEVKSKIRDEVGKGKVPVQKLASYVQEQCVGSPPVIPSHTTTDQIMASIQHRYTFLSPNLLLSLAIFFLKLHPIAKEAKTYESKIASFKKSVSVRSLKNELGRFNEQFRKSPNHSANSILKIIVKNAWGERSIRLVETLLLTLFPIVHPDDLPWYSVCAGSLMLSFIASNHMLLPLIVSCAKKMELMKHLGVTSVTIGNVLIRVNTEVTWALHDFFFSFENCLLEATIKNNFEAVEFLLNYAQVYVDAIDKTFTLVQKFYLEHTSQLTEDKAIDILKFNSEQLKAIGRDIELHHIMSGYHDDPNISHEFIQEIEFHVLNTEYLHAHLGHLPNPIKQRLTDLYEVVENHKIITKITYLQKLLKPFPSLNYTTRVAITLHKVWSACSVTNVEKAIKLLFPKIPNEFYWYNVKEMNRTLKLMLQINPKKGQLLNFDRYSAKALGVIEAKINNETIFESRKNKHGYTFEKGIRMAKESDDECSDKVFSLLKSVCLIPCQKTYKSNIEPDHNYNYQSCPDSDSTPLLIACCNTNIQLVQLLLENGADPNIHTLNSNSAVFYSANNSRIFQMLVDYGAKIDHETLLEHACVINCVKVVDILLTNKSPHINRQGTMGYTALWRACARGHIDVVNQLLQAKADPTIVDDEGSTPLYAASCNGRLSVVKRLLQAKINPNQVNEEGKSALYIACAFGRTEVVECLLQAQADHLIPDNNGVTPLQIAVEREHLWTASALFNHVLANCETNEEKVAWIAAATEQLNKHVIKKFLQARTDPTVIERLLKESKTT